MIGGHDETTVEKWLLDAGSYKNELRSVAGEIRKATKDAKDQTLVQQTLAKQTAATEKGFASMASSMAKGVLSANLASAALKKLGDGLKWVIAEGLTWNDWIGDNSAALDGMSRASAGIISKLDLVRARTKLTTGDFQASEGQLNALSKAAVHYARIVKVDLRTAIDALSDAAISGRGTRQMRQLGIDIEFTGTASEKTAGILRTLEERFGGVTVEATNVNEQMSQMKSSLSNAVGELGHAIVSSSAFQDVIQGLSLHVRALAGDLDSTIVAVAAFANVALPMMGGAGSRMQKDILAALDAAKRMRAETARLKAEGIMGPVMPPPTISGKADRPGGKPRGARRSTGPGWMSDWGGAIDKGLAEEDAAAAEEAAMERTLRVISLQEQLNILRVEEAARTNASAQALQRHTREMQLAREPAIAYTDAIASAATGLAGGFLSAVDAAIQGQANLGVAMLQVIKQTSMALAGQFFARAAASYAAASIAATNPLTAWEAPILTAQGHGYLAYGGVAAAGGLGLSLVTAGASRAIGGSSSAAPGASDGTRAAPGGTYRPPHPGRRDGDDKAFQPTVNVYLDTGDPASMMHWRKRIKSELNN